MKALLQVIFEGPHAHPKNNFNWGIATGVYCLSFEREIETQHSPISSLTAHSSNTLYYKAALIALSDIPHRRNDRK